MGLREWRGGGFLFLFFSGEGEGSEVCDRNGYSITEWSASTCLSLN